jgi:putative transposase
MRAHPTMDQVAVLNRTFGRVRLVWNTVLAWRQARYRTEGLSAPYADTDRCSTELKRDPGLGFLSEVSSVPLQRTLRHRYAAFANVFAGRARRPRYKSRQARQARQAATFTRSAFRRREGRLHLARTTDTPLAVVWSRPEADPASIEPASVPVWREPDGRWYVSCAVDIGDPQHAPPTGAEHPGGRSCRACPRR